MLAAMLAGRNSIGIEIEPNYVDIARKRLENESKDLFRDINLEVHCDIENPTSTCGTPVAV